MTSVRTRRLLHCGTYFFPIPEEPPGKRMAPAVIISAIIIWRIGYVASEHPIAIREKMPQHKNDFD